MLLVTTSGGPSPAQATVVHQYSYQVLPGYPGAPDSLSNAINDQGIVAGASIPDGYRPRAVRWIDGALVPVPSPAIVRGFSVASDIANNGAIAGRARFVLPKEDSDETAHATLWRKDSGPIDLGTLTGYQSSNASGMNEAGLVVGDSSGRVLPSRATLFRAGRTPVALLPYSANSVSIALDINNLNQIVGTATDSNGQYAAVVFENHTARALTPLPGARDSIAYSINDAGTIIGVSGNRAAQWDLAGNVTDLGTLPGDTTALAYAVNSLGDAVGTSYDSNVAILHAVLFHAGATIDLAPLVPDLPPSIQLLQATDINATGQITARANSCDASSQCVEVAVLLTPTG